MAPSTPKDEDFRLFCVEQVDRLGVFERFQFMNTAGKKEFRKFFESRTRDRAKVEAVMDEAIKFETLPNLADIRGIWDGLFPRPDLGPPVTDEERQARAEYLRDWYAQEAKQAAQRRAKLLNPSITPVSPSDIDREVEKLRVAKEGK